MGLLLYGGLGLLPLWVLIAYALLAQPGGASQASDTVLWWTVGAVPACFMTLMFAEAIMVSRERRHDPWRQHKILLIVAPCVALLVASGLTWERQEDARIGEEARITRFVAQDPGVVAWLGPDAPTRVTLSQPNADLTGAPQRYWVTAESGRRRVQAVVHADRAAAAERLTLLCAEREMLPVLRDKPPLRCPR
ncbi:hypothetical protein WG902_16450 [Ramlibacter sp. PS3R-8]|uniref:hypothetical protein n=1 Tax=Ramlibacter sp. PS3R-8 TaxID=3133437 RepID=UPI003096048F